MNQDELWLEDLDMSLNLDEILLEFPIQFGFPSNKFVNHNILEEDVVTVSSCSSMEWQCQPSIVEVEELHQTLLNVILSPIIITSNFNVRNRYEILVGVAYFVWMPRPFLQNITIS